MGGENTCRVRVVESSDGASIPVPAGGIGLANGTIVDIRDDAEVQISKGDSGYYVVVNNADASNDEASGLFSELSVEGAITTLERMAGEAFSAVPAIALKAVGFGAGLLVSLFTTSKLTQEIFIRGTLLDNGSRVTYCLLV
jgi:hypothetical protein